MPTLRRAASVGSLATGTRHLRRSSSVGALVQEVTKVTEHLDRAAFDVVVVLDTSSSMKGKPIKDAKRCVADLYRLLGDDDGLALITFDTEIRLVMDLTRKKDGLADALERSLLRVECGGRTRLWDSVFQGFELLCCRKRNGGRAPSHPYLIVVTDGMDNESKMVDKDEVKAILSKPGEHGYGGPRSANFHLNFLTVGPEADQAAASALCRKGHMKHFHAPSLSEINQGFWKIYDCLRVTIEHTRTTVVTAEVPRDGKMKIMKDLKAMKPGHDRDAAIDELLGPAKPVCKYFLRGKCRFGAKCWNSHDV
eukprot:Skav221006  [mRNA]  locus=scaffold2350:12768:13694:+ [translate_table: standard]